MIISRYAALVELADEGLGYPRFLVVQPVADGIIRCRCAASRNL